jgi:uncharacterized protein YggE
VLEQVGRSASEATHRVSFDVSDHKVLRRRAVQAAVEDIQEAARVLADSAGIVLGEIERLDYSFVEVRTRFFSYGPSDPSLSELGLVAPDIEPEAMEAEEAVTVVWSVF